MSGSASKHPTPTKGVKRRARVVPAPEPRASEEHVDETSLLTPLRKNLDALVERVKDAEARVGPSRWFG